MARGENASRILMGKQNGKRHTEIEWFNLAVVNTAINYTVRKILTIA
jgi:hypothetical protein